MKATQTIRISARPAPRRALIVNGVRRTSSPSLSRSAQRPSTTSLRHLTPARQLRHNSSLATTTSETQSSPSADNDDPTILQARRPSDEGAPLLSHLAFHSIMLTFQRLSLLPSILLTHSFLLPIFIIRTDDKRRQTEHPNGRIQKVNRQRRTEAGRPSNTYNPETAGLARSVGGLRSASDTTSAFWPGC